MARRRAPTDHTDHVTYNVSYGDGVPGDDELRLIGDVGGGKRVIELGISEAYNAVALAAAGVHAIALDTSAERIAETRAKAVAVGASVECHQGDLGDLGFAPSGTIDVVIASHTLTEDDDLGRILRQVHRVLKPSAPFVLALPHPFAAVAPGVPYGASRRTVGDLLTALARARFRIEVFLELGVDSSNPVPTTLVVKARKEGS
jgi:SAM-dependent methyltransferase